MTLLRFIPALAAIALLTSTGIGAAAPGPPNVLFLAVDDLKPMLGCYGNTRVKSPSIDRLADEGTVFLNNHCQWPVCGPSRASLMTGLMPEETGVMGFKAMRGRLPDVITLPQHFRNHGYETASVGKLNDPRCVGTLNPDNPTDRTLDGRKADDPPSWSIPYQHPVGHDFYTSPTKRSCEGPDRPDRDFTDGGVCERGVELLETLAKGDKPFFLGVGFYKPHVPWYAPKQYWDLYERDDFPLEDFQELPAGGTLGAWKKGTEVHGFPDTPNAYRHPEKGEMVYPRLPDDKDSVRDGILTHKGGYAFRTSRYRYIEFLRGGKVTSRDLYDYEADPKETANLADDENYADLIKQLARSMRETPEAAGCPGLTTKPKTK